MNTPPRLTCPSCDTAPRLNATPPAGSRFKCPNCNNAFTYQPPAPAAKPPQVVVAAPPAKPPQVVAVQPAPKANASKVVVRPVPKPVVKKSPAKPAQSTQSIKTNRMFLIGGGIVGIGAIGFVFLAVLIGGVIFWRSGRSSAAADSKTARVKETAPPVVNNPPPRTIPPVPVEPPPPPKPLPPVNVLADGSLDPELVKRIKQATLLIKVVETNGDASSGSGFFEESSGYIITNAHVVGVNAPTDKPPTKIEVVVNSGLPNKKTLPGKLIAVDTDFDLAILEVQLPVGMTQAKLPVMPAKDVQETQRVYVCGFPLGEEANKNVTINNTTVSSLHLGSDGVVTKVQVNGGMDHGNSGGPVIDARGNVIGVAFSGYESTSVKFAIPGESVRALLEGRVSTISVETEAVSRNGKLAVPVTVKTIDPRKRITQIAVDYWTGPANQAPPGPSVSAPVLGGRNSHRQSVNLTYDVGKGQGKGELILDAVPDGTSRVWVQPVVTNGTGKQAWLPGMPCEVDPPVDAKPLLVKARQNKLGAVPVHLKSTAKYKVKDTDFAMSVDTGVNELTTAVAPNGAALLQMNLQRPKISYDDEKRDASPEMQEAMKDAGSMVFSCQSDAQGNLSAKKIAFTKNLSAASKKILPDFGEQIQQAFEVVSVAPLGTLLQPGQKWVAKREMPVAVTDKTKPAMTDVTYTYRGVRSFKGRQVAVVDLRGSLKSAGQVGELKGTVLIDPESGMVVQGKAGVVSMSSVTVRLQRDRRSVIVTLQAQCSMTIKLQRGFGVD